MKIIKMNEYKKSCYFLVFKKIIGTVVGNFKSNGYVRCMNTGSVLCWHGSSHYPGRCRHYCVSRPWLDLCPGH